ncbi:MAG: DUF1836 domain-containing protein [Peptococcaceae bacterium]|nr:DUF1836 domain-containing protein [Peptococcaceae bacterium]
MNQNGEQTLWDYRGVDSSEIPNIDIYMDQLLTFFDTSYGFLRRDPKESVLTKAMINNYVKAGIMDKPLKKKYNQNQVKKLIMIYHLKLVLAIQDIKRLFQGVEKANKLTGEFYQKFLDIEHAAYEELAVRYAQIDAQQNNKEVLIHTILSLSTEACARKRLAEKLLDKLRDC